MMKKIMLGVFLINIGGSNEDKYRIMMWLVMEVFKKIIHKKNKYQNKINQLQNLILKDVKICINNLTYVLMDSESLGILSPNFEDWMNIHLKPKEGDVFIDIGSHLGKYTLSIANIVGEKGLVVSVEAHPINYNYLIKNIKLNAFTNIIPLNIAAWKNNSKIKIHHGDMAGHHSLKISQNLGYTYVQAKKMDDVLNKINIKKVNWVKIDVEGAEYECLVGLNNTINTYKPIIIIEIFQNNLGKIRDFFKKRDYLMSQISSSHKDLIYYIAKPIKNINLTGTSTSS